MENQKVMQFVEEAVREEIRKGKLVKSVDVLLMLPEVIDTVHINRERIQQSIQKCLSNRNPLNAILSLFGVQLIKKEKINNNFFNSGEEYEGVAVEIDGTCEKRLFTLNPKEFKTVVKKISQRLYELESQANQMYDTEKERGDELFRKYEKLTREYDKLNCSAEINEKLIAEKIQYILSLGGKEAVSDNEQLIELLKDLGIDVYWECMDVPLTDAEMFTEYVIDDEASISVKPCLVRNGVVYIKGVRLIKNKM